MGFSVCCCYIMPPLHTITISILITAAAAAARLAVRKFPYFIFVCVCFADGNFSRLGVILGGDRTTSEGKHHGKATAIIVPW